MNASAGRDVRFGFLGAGMIAASRLAPAVHAAAGASLHAVAARDGDRARRLEPAGRVYADDGGRAYRALLDDPDVDVVYISLTNEAHVPWAIRALEAGKHVLCEKPLALDAAGAAEAFEAARAAGRLLVEAVFYRWHPRTRWAEQLVAAGELGDVQAVDSAFSFGDVDWTGARASDYRLDVSRGGGALYDLAGYPLSIAQWALPGFGHGGAGGGGVVVESTDVAWSGDSTPPDASAVDLRVDAQLRTSTGGTARIRAAIIGFNEESATLTGTEAVLSLDSPTFTACDIASTATISDPAGGVTPSIEVFDPANPYRLMVEAVAARIRGEDAFVVAPADSMAVALAGDAVRAAITLTQAADRPSRVSRA